ncbi:MAG: type I-B CRISPR-associated protein Cas5 [Candidatus Roseilinea sp.]|nr:MAG: type I-B CRISPR-associated protein Cas5 [Candidatus Roseilinea sp.]
MRVLKIILEGVTTSFRYPNFMLGVQPSYEMPPPATIYGHICSALGEWVNPADIQFAYRFTFERKLRDLEHIHVLAPSGGRLPGTRMPKVLEGNVNPFWREVLFQPRLTLYLNKPEWEAAFRSPRYPVVLGRSQDLCGYTDVRVIELVERGAAYFEHTLIPFDHPWKTAKGVVVTMPRLLDYANNRRPTFARYIILRQRVASDDDSVLYFGPPPQTYWVDPESPESAGKQMGLVFHTLA